jgi:hypothetical protein
MITTKLELKDNVVLVHNNNITTINNKRNIEIKINENSYITSK